MNDELLTRTLAAQPDLNIEPAEFKRHVEQVCAPPEHLGDVLLALSTLARQRKALQAFEALVTSQRSALTRFDSSPAFADEVLQEVRTRVLVGPPPRLASYTGQGPLGGWLRVIALRVALDLRRAPAPSGDDVMMQLVDHEPDVELRHLKQAWRTQFRAALSQALAHLDDRQRTMLRLHFVCGMRLAQLGKLYGVHESTASRWVKVATEQVASDARARLVAMLSGSHAELESVERLVHSNLELSIGRLLQSRS